MAKTRVKKVVISGITSEQAEIAFSEFATADAKVQNIQSKMDMEITRIRDKYAETRSHTDGFRRNNANRWNKREICRFYLYSSIIWF